MVVLCIKFMFQFPVFGVCTNSSGTLVYWCASASRLTASEAPNLRFIGNLPRVIGISQSTYWFGLGSFFDIAVLLALLWSRYIARKRGTWVFVAALRQQQRIEFERSKREQAIEKARERAAKVKASPALFDGDLQAGDALEYLDQFIDRTLEYSPPPTLQSQPSLELVMPETFQTLLEQSQAAEEQEPDNVTLCSYVFVTTWPSLWWRESRWSNVALAVLWFGA